MPFVKVMINAVWGTKNHVPFLIGDAGTTIITHIKENAKSKQICIDRINCYKDHVRCLFELNADISIAKTLQLLKGESAYWINKNKITKTKFEWSAEYYAGSVSEPVLNTVRKISAGLKPSSGSYNSPDINVEANRKIFHNMDFSPDFYNNSYL